MNKTKLVFIVDDDEDDREIFSEVLREVDPLAKCKTAANGRDALDYLNNPENPLPDFLFLDLNMPIVDGKQCLAEIKRTERLKNIHVIVYSTSKRPLDIQEVNDMGVTDFITKPNLYTEIRQAIENILIARNNRLA